MSKRRNWILIAFGVFVLLVFLGIGAVIATTAWVQNNLTVTEATEGSAQEEFDKVRARYAHRPPLLEMRDGRPVYTGGKRPETPATSTDVANLHVLVWDPKDDRLVSVAIPFWLLRLKSGPIEFSSYASGWDGGGVDLRPEDLEKHGPGIILDTTGRDGERVLLWTQ